MCTCPVKVCPSCSICVQVPYNAAARSNIRAARSNFDSRFGNRAMQQPEAMENSPRSATTWSADSILSVGSERAELQVQKHAAGRGRGSNPELPAAAAAAAAAATPACAAATATPTSAAAAESDHRATMFLASSAAVAATSTPRVATIDGSTLALFWASLEQAQQTKTEQTTEHTTTEHTAEQTTATMTTTIEQTTIEQTAPPTTIEQTVPPTTIEQTTIFYDGTAYDNADNADDNDSCSSWHSLLDEGDRHSRRHLLTPELNALFDEFDRRTNRRWRAGRPPAPRP